MKCNIDAKGRRVRRNGGIACLAIGGAVGVAALRGTGPGAFGIISAFLITCGLFQLFESYKGWCVVRAMGFKTRV